MNNYFVKNHEIRNKEKIKLIEIKPAKIAVFMRCYWASGKLAGW